MAATVFKLHFEADLSGPRSGALTSRLGLTLNRIDDWDRLVGFRLVGASGAIRLFLSPKSQTSDRDNEFDLSGTATDVQDQRALAALYNECVSAIESMGGRIDFHGAIDPSNLGIDGETGRPGIEGV
ncbi:MAG: hypothetical protein ABJF01_20175 [bacterium]